MWCTRQLGSWLSIQNDLSTSAQIQIRWARTRTDKEGRQREDGQLQNVSKHSDKEHLEYILRDEAERTMELACMDCGKKIILKRGEIRRSQFARYHNSSSRRTYYSNPSESQIRKDAKHKLALFLRQRRGINISWECPHKDTRDHPRSLSTRYENYRCIGEGCTRVTHQSEDRVEVEYRDPAGRFVADVAVLNGKVVKYVCN